LPACPGSFETEPAAIADVVEAGSGTRQATKTGMPFVLNRETGEPIFPFEERQVPASDVTSSWSNSNLCDILARSRRSSPG
jgi:glucose dehydrogenase